jgi:hypothetical protein
MAMNRYASLAYEHWRTHRADEFAGMGDRETFFAQLGEQISYQVAELTRQLERDGPPGEAYLAKAARFREARQRAEEQVLRDTLTVSAAPPPTGDPR